MNKKFQSFARNVFFSVVITLSFSLVSTRSVSQEKEYKVSCVAFYNLENLLDTVDSPDTNDAEFTPGGSKKWNTEKFYKKIHNMANVISQIGKEYIKGGPYVLGVTELENRDVLEELTNDELLRESNYKIVHYDSPDYRGIDCALLYRADYFTVTESYPVKFTVPDDQNPYGGTFTSRDVLVVRGLLQGEETFFLVNHWPSKRGGEKVSAPLRCAAADLNRQICDSILLENPNAKIFMMGDLNDDPVAKSMTKHLRAKGDKEKLGEDDLYNPFYEKYKKGYGTTAYRDAWGLFDQIVVSQALLGEDKKTFKLWKSMVFNEAFITTKSGQYEGYPFRTFDFDTFQNGYSDHYPSYLFLIKEK